MKGVIVFKSRYGATELYAKWLGHILGLPVYEADDITPARLNGFDYVICGTSLYVGKMLIAKWLRSYQDRLSGKKVFMFIVCATPATDMTAFNKIIASNVSRKMRDSISFFFLRGRVIKKALTLSDRIILRMGALMQKDKKAREKMLADFDDVKKENLKEIVEAIKSGTNVANQVLG